MREGNYSRNYYQLSGWWHRKCTGDWVSISMKSWLLALAYKTFIRGLCQAHFLKQLDCLGGQAGSCWVGLWTLHPAALQRLFYTEMPGNCRTRGERVVMEECKGRSWCQKRKGRMTLHGAAEAFRILRMEGAFVKYKKGNGIILSREPSQGLRAWLVSLGLQRLSSAEWGLCVCPAAALCTGAALTTISIPTLFVEKNHDFYKQKLSEQFLQKGTKWAVCSLLL